MSLPWPGMIAKSRASPKRTRRARPGQAQLNGMDAAPQATMNSSTVRGMPECALYGRALARLVESEIPFLIGGAFALERYTGIARNTKDLDIFLRPRDLDAALAVLSRLGCE